jgi:hypothetical protein
MFSFSNTPNINTSVAVMYDGVGNQQLAPEGRTKGKCSLYTPLMDSVMKENGQREREREKIGQRKLN